jgi:hypothetical protein
VRPTPSVMLCRLGSGVEVGRIDAVVGGNREPVGVLAPVSLELSRFARKRKMEMVWRGVRVGILADDAVSMRILVRKKRRTTTYSEGAADKWPYQFHKPVGFVQRLFQDTLCKRRTRG